jgi:prepilin-type N-terminal cleavage/methylation domain-containing protein
MIRTKLSNHLRDVRKNEGGFTLIELLIVIVVLGILAGIVVFGVGTFKTDSEAAAKAANCKTVNVAAEAYNAKEGTYPASLSVLLPGGATPKGYIKTAPSGMTGATAINATTGEAAGCP